MNSSSISIIFLSLKLSITLFVQFTSYDAKVEFDDATKTFKKLVANIDTNSIDTGIEKRDNHLRSDDFFCC